MLRARAKLQTNNKLIENSKTGLLRGRSCCSLFTRVKQGIIFVLIALIGACITSFPASLKCNNPLPLHESVSCIAFNDESV